MDKSYSVYIKNDLTDIGDLIDEINMPLRVNFDDRDKALKFADQMCEYGFNPVIWIQTYSEESDD